MKVIDAHVHLGNLAIGNIVERLNIFETPKIAHKILHSILMKGASGHKLDVKKFLDDNSLQGCVLVPLSKSDENFIQSIEMKNVFRLKFFDYSTKKCDLGVFDGYKIHPVIERLDVNSVRYEEFFLRAEAKKIPIAIHIGFYPLEHHAKFGSLEKFEALLDRFNLRIVVSHGGGEHWKRLAQMADNYDFYTDLSLCSGKAVEELYEELGPKKIMFGSDFPIGNPLRRMRFVSEILPKRDAKRIFYSNARRFFS